MPFNGVIKTEQIVQKTVIDLSHPPIVKGATFDAATGVLEAGTIVARNATRHYVGYENGGAGSLGVPVGVLDEDIDTSKQQVARVLLHGVAVREHVKLKAGNATQEDIDLLMDAGVYVL